VAVHHGSGRGGGVTTITLEGGKELAAALRNASKDMQFAVEVAVVKTAQEFRTDIQNRIRRGPNTGKIYKRGRKTHQASFAGEAPMNDRGGLITSVYFEQESRFTSVVGSLLVYSAYLEYGTTRMKARPMWRPAVEDMRPVFIKRLRVALGMALD
jgi:HK97 gp10 family phage protein